MKLQVSVLTWPH